MTPASAVPHTPTSPRLKERTAQVMLIGAWVAEGAQVSAGSNSPPSSPDPLSSVWDMVTRGTRQVRVQGLEYALDRYTAFQLYTLGTATLYWEQDRRGTLQPGRLAEPTISLKNIWIS